jgi:DNA polymerase (family 10)
MKNADIASIFNNLADLLEIQGENPFRIRAYRKAAFNVGSMGKDVASLSKKELMEIPGIGSDLAGKIEEYTTTGKVEAYEKLKQVIPEGLVTLLDVPGLGPKTVSLLYKEFHIGDIDQLERLARGHKLSTLPGIKEKTEAAIIKGIEMIRRYAARYPIGKVLPLSEEIRDYLRARAPVKAIEVAGSIRRWKETIKDIDIICTAADANAVMRIFSKMPDVTQVLMKGPTKSSVVIRDGIQVDIRVVEEDSFGSAIAYFTGSKAHNIRLRELAVKRGYKLNEYGIFREKDNRKLGGSKEEDIYEILGLQYVPPELREDTGEIEAAQQRSLPELVEMAEIRGDLHVHSNWSDGSIEIGDVTKRPLEKGYEYIALTDHTKGLGVARGLREEKVLEQLKAIEALNKKLKGFRLLSGVEINIKNDGTLDFEDALLARLDVVVASIHSGFKQSREQLTGRTVKAMQNPHVSVIAHPSGRLIGERDAYEIDMEQVIETAAETGTAIEINAYPLRLDLSESYVRLAKTRGAPIVISTDSHNEGQFDNMKYGVAIARRGWLEKKDVLNTLPCKKLLLRLRKKRPREMLNKLS